MGTSVSSAFMARIRIVFMACAICALASGFMPATSFAGDQGLQETSASQVERPSSVAPLLTSGLVGSSAGIVSSDVTLDSGEPIIGSFTVDGLTFVVTEGANVQLIGVSEATGTEAEGPALLIPGSVIYNGVEYSVASIGAYAFYLSGVTSVELPASVVDVDNRAFRSSDVASVEVADGNPAYSSFDGALYDADQLSLLLIPEGKQGTVLLPKTAESAPPSVFSHCPLVTRISVEEGSAAFASENGLLYDASLTTLLRVPAGATEIAIHDGCTTIAAGAMEGCASLERINASASIATISPYLFEQQPETVMAPVAVAAVEDDVEGGSTDEGEPTDAAQQLSAMVALSSTDDGLPTVDPAAVAISLPSGADAALWRAAGFLADESQGEAEGYDEVVEDIESEEADLPVASLGSASTYAATYKVNRMFNLPTVYARTSNNGTWGSWVESIAEQNTWLTPNMTDDMYRFYDGNLWIRNSSAKRIIRYAASSSGGTFDGCRVGTSPDNLSEITASSSYTSISSDVYIQLYNMTTVTLNPNGGTAGSQTSVGIYYAGTAALPAACKPSRAGYTFMGFYGGTSSSSTKYFNADLTAARSWSTTSKTATLYAHWSINSYTITWNANGGSVSPTSSSKAYGSALGTLPTPTRTGYAFAGWFTAASGGSQISTTTTVPAANTTYYAHWTPNPYTVEYWNKAGTTKLSSDTGFKYDTARNLAAKPSSGVSAGYTAVGWATATNQTKAAYGFSSSQKNLATSGTKKLYLAETANTITLTWNSQGGSAVANTMQTYASGAKVKLPANPTRTGYAFKGWFTAASGGTQITASTALPTANATYHAQWTASTYDVTFNGQGGTVHGSATWTASNPKVTFGTGNWVTMAAAVRAGYAFKGYYTAASGGAQVYKPGANGLASATNEGTYWKGGLWSYAGNATFHAQWEAKTIALEWSLSYEGLWGDTEVMLTEQTYADGAKLALPDPPTREGYHFAGWFTSASGGTQVTSSTALPTANATYYAHWVAKGPQVQFHAGTSIWRTIDRSSGGAEGAGSFPSPYSGLTYTASLALASGRVDAAGVPSTGDPKEVVYHVGLDQSIGGVTSAWLVTGDAEGKKAGSWLSSSGASIAGKASADVYLNGYGASTVTWDAGEGECDTERTEDVMPYDTVTAPAASRKGYIMAGWYDGTAEDAKLACKPGAQSPQVTGDVTYYAKWVPAVSAVAPIQATVRLDLLGTEDQAMDEDAPGYIESRCGEPLDVASVAFEAKPGSAELFGAYVPDIELQALPGKDASWETGSPAFSFALDAAGDAAIEDDASKLAGLSMSGYEVRIPIAYRFAIPDSLLEEVLASIDPARFEQVTTPACSVVYTVALAP